MHVSKPPLPTPFSRVPPQDLAGIKLNLQLRDYDRMSQDDFIGEAWVDLEKELVPDVLGRPCYSGVWGDGEWGVSLTALQWYVGRWGEGGGQYIALRMITHHLRRMAHTSEGEER
jgi:hypothetical protein